MQQLAAAAHVAPSDSHWFGPEQRVSPSTSTSQCPEQHWAFCVQRSLVSLHEDAGTEQTPFTQLSEQQSVLLLQLWW